MNENHHSSEHSSQPFHHAFDNPHLFAEKFDNPERDLWQKPSEVLTSLALADDAIVVEIGPGTGYFTIRLAEQVKRGKVIAVESSPQMAEYLRNRVEGLGIINVEVLVPENDVIPHLEEKVDLLLCIDVYHHIPERISYFSHLKKDLRAGGKLVIIDRAATAPIGPPLEHRISPELVQEEMIQAGFQLVQQSDFLLPYQYVLSFRSSDCKTLANN